MKKSKGSLSIKSRAAFALKGRQTSDERFIWWLSKILGDDIQVFVLLSLYIMHAYFKLIYFSIFNIHFKRYIECLNDLILYHLALEIINL